MMIMQPSADILRQLAELLDAGAIRTVVTKAYPLSQAPDAWRYQMSGHTRGKVVLEVSA
jgi:NADPH:quinone reductase-like Zn-dependent oxidoreductase